jgi:signal transduction histidine kinase
LADDLRAPLAAIRELSNQQLALEEIAKLDKLADDLLELSRVGSSEIKVRFEAIDLRKIVEDALANTRHLIEAKSVELAVQLGDRPIMVNGDRDRLVQAATNLLLNAQQTTPARGRVGIACVANDRFGLVIVEDNGAGVPGDLLPDIFAGPALGLAIAHRLVSHHDGVLTASSGGANQGSTFVIKLPRI